MLRLRGDFIKRCNIPTKVGEWRLSLYRSIHKVKSMTDWRKEFRGRRLAAARRHDATTGQSVSSFAVFPLALPFVARNNVPRRDKTRPDKPTCDSAEQMVPLSRETINQTASVSGCQIFAIIFQPWEASLKKKLFHRGTGVRI